MTDPLEIVTDTRNFIVNGPHELVLSDTWQDLGTPLVLSRTAEEYYLQVYFDLSIMRSDPDNYQFDLRLLLNGSPLVEYVSVLLSEMFTLASDTDTDDGNAYSDTHGTPYYSPFGGNVALVGSDVLQWQARNVGGVAPTNTKTLYLGFGQAQVFVPTTPIAALDTDKAIDPLYRHPGPVPYTRIAASGELGEAAADAVVPSVLGVDPTLDRTLRWLPFPAPVPPDPVSDERDDLEVASGEDLADADVLCGTPHNTIKSALYFSASSRALTSAWQTLGLTVTMNSTNSRTGSHYVKLWADFSINRSAPDDFLFDIRVSFNGSPIWEQDGFSIADAMGLGSDVDGTSGRRFFDAHGADIHFFLSAGLLTLAGNDTFKIEVRETAGGTPAHTKTVYTRWLVVEYFDPAGGGDQPALLVDQALQFVNLEGDPLDLTVAVALSATGTPFTSLLVQAQIDDGGLNDLDYDHALTADLTTGADAILSHRFNYVSDDADEHSLKIWVTSTTLNEENVTPHQFHVYTTSRAWVFISPLGAVPSLPAV